MFVVLILIPEFQQVFEEDPGLELAKYVRAQAFIVSYEQIAGKTALLTWLQNMSAYSAGHNFTVSTGLHAGSKNDNIAAHKTEVLLQVPCTHNALIILFDGVSKQLACSFPGRTLAPWTKKSCENGCRVPASCTSVAARTPLSPP